MGEDGARNIEPSRSDVLPLDSILLWGLPASPVLLMMLSLMAKTPFLGIEASSGAYCACCTIGSVVGFSLALLTLRHGAAQKLMRAVALVAAAVFEASWAMMYALGYLGSVPVLCGCTFLACAACSALFAMWMRIGQSSDTREAAVKYSAALMGAFVLYTLFSVFPDPVVVAYAYAPASYALFAWRLSKQTDPVVLPDETCLLPEFVGIRMLGDAWPQTAAAVTLFASLGTALAVLAEPNPPLGAFYGLGIASLVLAAAAASRGRELKVMGVAAGPLAIAGACSVPVFGAGTAFALFLAGCGLYVVRTLALVETAKIPRGEDSWQIELILLVAMSTCVLFGFLLTRLVVETDVGATDALSGAALLLVAADAFWRASTLSQAEGKMPERDSIPSVADALWLAETFGLTPRETEVAALLCENRSVPYICERLGLATSTTKTHVSRIYEKAGVHSRDALQLLATSRGTEATSHDENKESANNPVKN